MKLHKALLLAAGALVAMPRWRQSPLPRRPKDQAEHCGYDDHAQRKCCRRA